MGIYQKLIEKPITLSFFLYILETNNLTQNVKNQKYSFFKLQESIAFTWNFMNQKYLIDKLQGSVNFKNQ